MNNHKNAQGAVFGLHSGASTRMEKLADSSMEAARRLSIPPPHRSRTAGYDNEAATWEHAHPCSKTIFDHAGPPKSA